MLHTLGRTLGHVLSLLWKPTSDALWHGRHLPWTLRWRLLAFQPVYFLGNVVVTFPYLVRRPFTVDYVPVSDDRSLRVLIFHPPVETNDQAQSEPGVGRSLRPLHIACHPGGFIGGLPESVAPFCTLVARRTGAVVVSLSYRLAPVHPFPAAIDDVDAALAWLCTNAESRYGADPTLMTVSGSSAGANLALAATQAPACHEPSPTAIKASVTFYAPVDLRMPPWEKPTPEKWPTDPLAFLQPLYDSYAAPAKAKSGDSARMNPMLARVETLPRKMLFVVPAIDIVVREQLEFVERVKSETESLGEERSVEVLYVEDGFHGYLEVPDAVVPLKKKMEAWGLGINLIRSVHEQHGWHWPSLKADVD